MVYPDPLMKISDTLYLRLDTTFQPSSAIMKVYSASFRLIKIVKWDASGITGHYTVNVPLSSFGSPANGTYYYVLMLKDGTGKEIRSRVGDFIILR